MNKVLINKLLGLFVVFAALTQAQGCSLVAVGAVGFKFTPGPAMHVKPNFVIGDWFYDDGKSYIVAHNGAVGIEFNANVPGIEWVPGNQVDVAVIDDNDSHSSPRSMYGTSLGITVRHPGTQKVVEVRVRCEFYRRGTHEAYSTFLREKYANKETSWLADRLKKEDKSSEKYVWRKTTAEARTYLLQVMTGSAIPDQDSYRNMKLSQLMKLASAKNPAIESRVNTLLINKLVEEELTYVLYLHFGQIFN